MSRRGAPTHFGHCEPLARQSPVGSCRPVIWTLRALGAATPLHRVRGGSGDCSQSSTSNQASSQPPDCRSTGSPRQGLATFGISASLCCSQHPASMAPCSLATFATWAQERERVKAARPFWQHPRRTPSTRPPAHPGSSQKALPLAGPGSRPLPRSPLTSKS